MRIVILSGGLSPERDVSKKSSSLVANALLSRGHKVSIVDLYEGLLREEIEDENFFRMGLSNPYSYEIPEEEPDLEKIIEAHGGRREWLGPNVIEACKLADVVFLGLHGGHGENGEVQAILNAHGIKYTGSDYLGSAIAMDKDLSKSLALGANIRTAKWITRGYDESSKDEIIEVIGIPCVIKPIGCGSSCGVSICYKEEEIDQALAFASYYKQNILIEEYIKGRELTIGILNGKPLPITEIIPHEGFYDYKNKYQEGLTDHICPANLTLEQKERLERIALNTFSVLRMKQYGRIDFFFNEENDEFVFIEANNLPGMTSTSLLPEACASMGIEYEELCELLCKGVLGEKN